MRNYDQWFYVNAIFPVLKAIALTALLVQAACFVLMLVQARTEIAAVAAHYWDRLTSRSKGRLQ